MPSNLLPIATASPVGGLAVVALTCIIEVAIHPAWYMVSCFLIMVIILPVYLLLLSVVPWRWFKASRADRRGTGLNLMILGFLLGLGPVILRLAVEAALGLTLPGSDWMPMVELAIPFFLALGVRRHASRPRPDSLRPAPVVLPHPPRLPRNPPTPSGTRRVLEIPSKVPAVKTHSTRSLTATGMAALRP
jgi:hypothetical protein